MDRFREKFGDLDAAAVTALLREMVAQFLHEPANDKKKETVAR